MLKAKQIKEILQYIGDDESVQFAFYPAPEPEDVDTVKVEKITYHKITIYYYASRRNWNEKPSTNRSTGQMGQSKRIEGTQRPSLTQGNSQNKDSGLNKKND